MPGLHQQSARPCCSLTLSQGVWRKPTLTHRHFLITYTFHRRIPHIFNPSFCVVCFLQCWSNVQTNGEGSMISLCSQIYQRGYIQECSSPNLFQATDVSCSWQTTKTKKKKKKKLQQEVLRVKTAVVAACVTRPTWCRFCISSDQFTKQFLRASSGDGRQRWFGKCWLIL